MKKILKFIGAFVLTFALIVTSVGVTALCANYLKPTSVEAAGSGTSFAKVSSLKGSAVMYKTSSDGLFKRNYLAHVKEVSWKKIEGASGYEYTFGSTWNKKMKTTNSKIEYILGWGSKLDMTLTFGSASNPKVKVFVRPYYVKAGKTTYGQWNSITIPFTIIDESK